MTDPYNSLGAMDPNVKPSIPLYGQPGWVPCGQPGHVPTKPIRWYNAAKCVACGVVVESTHRHHFATHSCKPEIWFAVDGGHDYCRRVWGVEGNSTPPHAHYIDISHELPEPWPCTIPPIGWKP